MYYVTMFVQKILDSDSEADDFQHLIILLCPLIHHDLSQNSHKDMISTFT